MEETNGSLQKVFKEKNNLFCKRYILDYVKVKVTNMED